MSVKFVQNPSGIDLRLSRLQNFLYQRLGTSWGAAGLPGKRFDLYGRVYRNSTKDGFLPQAFESGFDYNADMFYDDRLDALIWFGLNDPTQVDGERVRYNMSMYVFVNIDAVAPGHTYQRMDERIINDVTLLLRGMPYGFVHTSTVRDIDNVLQKFGGYRKKLAEVNNNHSSKLAFRCDMYVNISVSEENCDEMNYATATGAIRVIIKDTPDPNVMQTLVNGNRIPLEYPSGASFTIPHLVDRYVFPNVIWNNNNIDGMAYDPSMGTFTPDGGTFDGDKGLIYYNEL